MSGGPYMVNFGSKLGTVQSPMSGAAAPNLAAPPNPAWAWAKWQPAGTAAMEGIEQGIKTGENLKQFPEQQKALDLANKSAAVDIAAKSAQIEQMEAQTYGLWRGAAGPFANTTKGPPPFTPTAGANARVIANQALAMVGLKAAQADKTQIPGENTASTGGTRNQPPQGQTQASTPTQAQATNQLPEGVPPEVAQMGGGGAAPDNTGTLNEAPPPEAVSPTATTAGDINITTPNNNVTPIESARSGWAAKNPATQGQNLNVSQSGLETPKVENLGIPAGLLEKQPDGSYTVKNPTKNLTMSPDGRYYVGTSDKTGAPVYYDPQKNDAYVYTPEAGGKERRFYSRYTNDDEWLHGVENDNPQEQQRLSWINYLKEQNVTPQAFFGAGARYPDWGSYSSPELLNAVEIWHNQQARTPVDSGGAEAQDMNRRTAQLNEGNAVLKALADPNLKPEDYNTLKSVIAQYADKYATTPVLGDIIKGMGIEPKGALSNLLQHYGAYLDLARSTTTGSRMMPDEFKALVSSIGNPQETNWSFPQRFGNNLNQERLNYIDRVDTMLASGKRMSWMDQTPNGFKVSVLPWVARADQLRPLVAGYSDQVRKDIAVPTQGGGGNASATPSQSPAPGAAPSGSPIKIKNYSEIVKNNLPVNTPIKVGDKVSWVQPWMIERGKQALASPQQ